MSHDDKGRLFYNSNSNPIQGDFTFPNQNGCDSIISVNLDFNDVVFENLEPLLCPGESIMLSVDPVSNFFVFSWSGPDGILSCLDCPNPIAQ